MTTLIESQRLIEPVEHAFPITPNDSAFLEHKTRGIIIGKVWATGTTATDIYGLW